VVDDVVDSLGLVWSWDGTQLAFSGIVDGRVGTWLFRATCGLSRLSDLPLAGMTWSPDGRTLIGSASADTFRSELVRVVVPPVVDAARE